MGVTEQGLKNMMRTVDTLKSRVDRLRYTLDQFTDEIQAVLDGHLAGNADEDLDL